MLIQFSERIGRPVAEVYDCFKSAEDWVRLYGLAGEVPRLGDGWVAVPLHAPW